MATGFAYYIKLVVEYVRIHLQLLVNIIMIIILILCVNFKNVIGSNVDNISPIHKIHVDKYVDFKGPKKSESMPNCCTKVSQESVKHMAQPLGDNLISTQSLEDQNESVITTNSMENMPLFSRNESKDDLRKYVKMVSKIKI